jgi:hypothetical protein
MRASGWRESRGACLGRPILRGRGIEPCDMSATPVAVISETMARFFFARQDAVGNRLRPTGEQGYLIKIIGVTKDAKVGTPRNQRGAWYFPYQQNPRPKPAKLPWSRDSPCAADERVRYLVLLLIDFVSFSRSERYTICLLQSLIFHKARSTC